MYNKSKKDYTTQSPEETFILAQAFAKTLAKGDTVILKGDLGAGKTHFCKGLVKAFGIDSDIVLSPTFVICRVYEGIKKVYHLDLYRIKSFDEAVACGVAEIIDDRDAVKLIEWPDCVKEILPPQTICVEITATSDNTRNISIYELSCV